LVPPCFAQWVDQLLGGLKKSPSSCFNGSMGAVSATE